MSFQLREAKDYFIMVDQNLVAIHDVSFLVKNNYPIKANHLAIVKQS